MQLAVFPLYVLEMSYIILPKFLNRMKLGMIRKEATICLTLQDMFRVHHPSSVANTE